MGWMWGRIEQRQTKGGEMKRRLVLGVVLALLFVGCGGGGGDGGPGDFDLTGTWRWTQTVTSSVCEWSTPVGETRSGRAVINQNGTQLVFRNEAGDLEEGTIRSNTIHLSVFRQGITQTFTGTVIDDSRVEGNTFAVANGCRIDYSEVWTRISYDLLF